MDASTDNNNSVGIRRIILSKRVNSLHSGIILPRIFTLGDEEFNQLVLYEALHSDANELSRSKESMNTNDCAANNLEYAGGF